MSAAGIITLISSRRSDDGILFKFLGIAVAFTWPIYTVLPDERFGGMLMLNGLLYGLLLLLSIDLLPRRDLSKLVAAIAIYFLLFYLTPVIQSLQLDSIEAGKKSFDIVITHLTFILAGFCAGRNFPLFAKYFFRTLLLILLANLAIELYPDFTIQNRTSIGLFGGQGFARIVSLTAIGLILTEKPPSFTGPKLAAGLVYFIAITLCIFAGARSSMIGITLALLVNYLDSKEKIIKFSLFSLVALALLVWLVSAFYVDWLRPILLDIHPNSGIRRILLSLDIFYPGEIGNKRTLASIMERGTLWREGIRVALEHPFGTGFGGYEKYSLVGVEGAPHNVPIELIVETGFVLGTAFLILTTLVVVAANRSILPYMIYLIIFFQFSGDFIDARQLMFFAAVALQLRIAAAQDKNEKSPLANTRQA